MRSAIVSLIILISAILLSFAFYSKSYAINEDQFKPINDINTWLGNYYNWIKNKETDTFGWKGDKIAGRFFGLQSALGVWHYQINYLFNALKNCTIMIPNNISYRKNFMDDSIRHVKNAFRNIKEEVPLSETLKEAIKDIERKLDSSASSRDYWRKLDLDDFAEGIWEVKKDSMSFNKYDQKRHQEKCKRLFEWGPDKNLRTEAVNYFKKYSSCLKKADKTIINIYTTLLERDID